MKRAAANKPLWRRLTLKSALAAFVVLVLVWNLRTTTFAKNLTTSPVKDTYPLDAIVKRMIEAQTGYKNLLERQSKNLHGARREYKRRYQRNPPEGFDKWYHYAVKHNSLIIDDFGVIDEVLKPFRSYYRRGCANRLKERKPQKFLEKNRLLQVCITNGTFTRMVGDQGDSQIPNALRKLSLDFISDIPDLCFQLNMADEPRSSLPYDTIQQDENEETFCPTVSFVSYEKQNWWAEATFNCKPDSPARKFPGRPEPPKQFKLLDDFQSDIDICSRSTSFDHGLLNSPSSLLQCHHVVPILSPAGLSTSTDVLMPTLYRYYEYGQYNETQDIPWEKKVKKAYWRGSTTGGYNSPHTWRKMHRHRLVSLVQNKDNNLQNLADVRFSRLVQCEQDDVCKELTDYYNFDGENALSEVWKNKIALDVDGNGLSGRFYPLLRSNSAVFRQTSKCSHQLKPLLLASRYLSAVVFLN